MLPVESLVKQINVEIDGLKAVAQGIRNELDKGLRSQIPVVRDTIQPDAKLGGPIAGDEWSNLHDVCTQSIKGTLEALHNVDLGTGAMADAAEVIASDYGNSDAFAQARVTDVTAILSPPPPPERSIRPNPYVAGPFTGTATTATVEESA